MAAPIRRLADALQAKRSRSSVEMFLVHQPARTPVPTRQTLQGSGVRLAGLRRYSVLVTLTEQRIVLEAI